MDTTIVWIIGLYFIGVCCAVGYTLLVSVYTLETQLSMVFFWPLWFISGVVKLFIKTVRYLIKG